MCLHDRLDQAELPMDKAVAYTTELQRAPVTWVPDTGVFCIAPFVFLCVHASVCVCVCVCEAAFVFFAVACSVSA